jgi:hypothetical protein
MMLRRKFRSWVFAFTATKIESTIGLNSILKDGNHVLMWDFDGYEHLDVLYNDLAYLQVNHELPDIYVFESSPKHYLALCLHRTRWIYALHILTELVCVDHAWIKACVTRGYFTIRIGTKHGHEPKPIRVLLSHVKETVRIEELENYDRYEIHASR